MAEQVHDDQSQTFTGDRLPREFVPKHYDLRLKPDLKQFTFDGAVEIRFAKPQVGNKITLHAVELSISRGHANRGEDKSSLKKVVYNSGNETATLIFDDQAGAIESIFLEFRGVLNDRLKGFYRTSFRLENKTVYAAATQFAATDARMCFPCWDEPSFKAIFSLTVEYLKDRDHNLVALSNMPIASQSQGANEDEVVVVYEKSPIMSTYLLAFVLGPFEYIEKLESKRRLRVYTTPGKKEQGRFALEVASKAVKFFEDYFDIPYPLPKMDLISIPDLSFSAMENWGLITYREAAILVDPQNTSTTLKQQVALTVCHEISHQWFGNLVTMEWWTHLWLNEGFARFMEYLSVDHIFPEYGIWYQFVSVPYSQALELDALHSSHPIEVAVKSSSEINEIFDAISYAKGGSLIRMLYHYIGDESFKRGLKSYLTKFAYRNAVTEDLWDALGATSEKPVREMMSRWTSQTGYPWLSVSFSAEGTNTKLVLTQSKFTANGKLSKEEESVRWTIPVAAISSNKENVSGLIGPDERPGLSELNLTAPSDGWVKLNPGLVGLYRTAYPSDMSARLRKAILARDLSPMDRLGILSDYFAMSQSGKVSTVDSLKLLEAYNGETDYNVWSSLSNYLSQLNILLSNTDYQDKYKHFGLKLYQSFKPLSWSPKANESHADALLRALIIGGLISFGDQAVISEAKNRFEAHVDGTSIIPADLRGSVFKIVSMHGDDSSFDRLFEIYRSSELSEEKLRILSALGSTKQGPRLDRVVEFILSSEVRNQDKAVGLFPIGRSYPQVSWKILRDNFMKFKETLISGALARRLVKFSIENFASEEMAVEIEEFFRVNRFPGTEMTMRQSVETIRINAAWLQRDSDAIKTFLSTQ